MDGCRCATLPFRGPWWSSWPAYRKGNFTTLAALLEVLPTKVESSTVRFKDPSGDNGVNSQGTKTPRVEIDLRYRNSKDSSRCKNPEAIDQLEVQRPRWNE